MGLIYKPSGNLSWGRTHAQVPFAFKLNEEVVRIYFATRDNESRSSTTYIEVRASNPSDILYVHDKPVLTFGDRGTYDDSGAMPSWFLRNGRSVYLYYTGWNKSIGASYRLSIGLAVSNDEGVTFKKMFKGPIMDRDRNDPIWVAQPCVLLDKGKWKMWYLSCEKIEVINGHPEPFYNVKYAESIDGINWKRANTVCIGFEFGKIDAIGRPCVFMEDGIFKMFHSNRKAIGYRENKNAGYSIGYSESKDGIKWKRMDNKSGISKSKNGWDSIMNEYCTTYKHRGVRYLIYNGNEFGKTGFGYAVKIE